MLLQVVVVLFVSILQICYGENDEYLQFSDDPLRESFGDVIYSSILFRHGDRSVIEPYPTDPYPVSFWKDGTAQLTKIGKLREYKLGEWVRLRYYELVNRRPFKNDFLLVNSSDIDRTLMSAELFLAGFYPPSEKDMWNHENLQWQPIPVHTLPKNIDNFIAMDKPCEKYNLELDTINNSPEFAAYFEEHRELFTYVSTHSGKELSKNDVYSAIDGLLDIFDDLFIEDQNNLTLPDWTRKIFPQPMKSVAEFYFSTIAYTREMQRLKGGPLLKSIIDDMKEKRDNSLWNRTFHFYSGHDTTVAVLLDTLGVFNRLAPPYSAAVIVELRKQNDDYYVTVLYRNSSEVPPFLLRVPGCRDNVCTLDEFIRATIDVIPDDWEYECEIGFLMNLYYFTYFDLIVLGFIVLILLSGLLIICKLHCERAARYRHYQIIQDNILNPDSKNSA